MMLFSAQILWAAGNSKPTIIFVHGAPGSANQFQTILSDLELSSAAKIVTKDRPGYGANDTGKPFYNLDDQVAAVVKTISENPGRIILVGYSFGVTIAMKVAEVIPQKIESLVLVSGVYDPDFINQRWFSGPMQWLSSPSQVLPRYYYQTYQEILNTSKDVENVMRSLHLIRAQVFVIHGEQDDKSLATSIKLLASLNPVVYIRKDRGHSLAKTDAVFINNFLKTLVRF